MLLETITGNDEGSDASQEELLGWASEHGLKMPVLADTASETMNRFTVGATSVGLPYKVLFDRGVVVETAGNFANSAAEELL
jgi:hypothetical protein